MKVLFLAVTVLLPLVFSGPAPQSQAEEEDGANMEYFVYESSPGVYEVEDLVSAEIDTKSSEADVEYHFFSQTELDGVNIGNGDLDALKNTRFTYLRDTVFIIHGWKDDNDAELNHHVREAIFSKHNVNVFVVDWGPIASKNYISAKNSVVQVGQYVANFIRALQSTYKLRLSKLSLVGFSLGAHVAGAAGAALDGEVDRIMGLDPAGPLFSVKKTEERLDPTDAQFVQVIHTSGGRLGFKDPAGHSDYYPNGGSYQPGCGLDIGGGCSHTRAYGLFSEAIAADSNLFVAKLCNTYKNFGKGLCDDSAKSVLGGYELDKSARGDYFLDTNSISPFALG